LTDQDLTGRHVVVTGATGALGGAVVALLVERGAICHLPVRGAVPAGLAGPQVIATGGVSLTDEAAVTRYYAEVPAQVAQEIVAKVRGA